MEELGGHCNRRIHGRLLRPSCQITRRLVFARCRSSEVLTPAIVTVHDFASLRVDSLSEAQGTFRYRITGQLNEEGTGRFARATEKAIGSRIAFLCDGRVVCTPAVHARIEDGNFLIVLEDDPGGVRTRRIYARLEAAMHGKRE